MAAAPARHAGIRDPPPAPPKPRGAGGARANRDLVLRAHQQILAVVLELRKADLIPEAAWNDYERLNCYPTHIWRTVADHARAVEALTTILRDDARARAARATTGGPRA